MALQLVDFQPTQLTKLDRFLVRTVSPELDFGLYFLVAELHR
jgi:hypothetical protein